MSIQAVVYVSVSIVSLIVVPWIVWVTKSVTKLNLDIALIHQERKFMHDVGQTLIDVKNFLSNGV